MESILENLNLDSIENVIIVYGDDYYLASEFIDNIVNLLPSGYQDIDFVLADEADKLKDILFECGNFPFMSSKRVVLLKRDKNLLMEDKKALDAYIKNPENSSVLLIFDISNVFKSYYKKVLSYEFNRLDFHMLTNRIKDILHQRNIEIDNNAIKLLIEYTNRYMSRISIELDKLIAYIGDRNEINIEDIKECITPEADYQIYQFINATTRKDKDNAIKLYRELLASGTPPIVLMSSMINQYRKLLHLLLTEKRIEDAELAKIFRAPTFTISKDRSLAKSFSQKELKKIIDKLYDLEHSFKSGKISINYALDTAVAILIA